MKRKYIIYLILALALFLRFHNIASTINFHEDEARDLLIAKYMIDTKHPILLGPQTSIGNFYLSPIYYYLITPFVYFFPLNFMPLTIFFGIAGICLVYLLYRYSHSPLVAALAAISPLLVQFSRSFWNPNLAPIIVTLVLLFDRKKNLLNSLIIGLLLGSLTSFHLIAVSLIISYFLYYIFVDRVQLKYLLVSILGIFISNIPLLLGLIKYHYLDLSSGMWILDLSYIVSLLTNSGNLILSYFHASSGSLLPTLLGFLVLIFLFKNWQTKIGFLILSSLLIQSLIGISKEAHYFGYLIPLLILLVNEVFLRSNLSKLLSIITFMGVCFFAAPIITRSISDNTSFSYHAGVALNSFLSTYQDSYNLVSSRETTTNTYQYFAAISSNPPTNEQSKNVLMLCEVPCTASDYNSPEMFVRGPAHIYLEKYLGHPQATYVVEKKELVKTVKIIDNLSLVEIKLSK